MDGFSQTNDKIAYSNDDLRLGMELLFYAYRDFIGPPDEILREHRLGRAHIGLFISWAAIRVLR